MECLHIISETLSIVSFLLWLFVRLRASGSNAVPKDWIILQGIVLTYFSAISGFVVVENKVRIRGVCKMLTMDEKRGGGKANTDNG